MTPLPINPTPQDYLDRIHEAFGMMLTTENIIKNCLDNYLHVTRHAAQEPDEKAKDLFGWHPASEKPESTEGWFLAVTKDGQPFITHYLNGWLPQVCQWQYIELPV